MMKYVMLENALGIKFDETIRETVRFENLDDFVNFTNKYREHGYFVIEPSLSDGLGSIWLHDGIIE